MKNKTLIFFFLILLFLSISCVSASEDTNQTLSFNQDTASLSIDDEVSADAVIATASLNSTIESENVQGVLSENENTLTAAGEGQWYVNSTQEGGNGKTPQTAFATLKEALDESDDGDTINIASGTYVGSGLNVDLRIDKKITLLGYGDGEVIFDAQNTSRIFTIRATCINITGLTFKNGRADTGGALYFVNPISHSNINANFIGNTATSSGGAIGFGSSVSYSTINGTFTNNKAVNYAGANYFLGTVSDLNITGTFSFNGADWNGGANSFQEDVFNSTISGTFTFNKAGFNGGVNAFNNEVYNSTVSGTYLDNLADMDGGANFFFRRVYNLNMAGAFTNNTAKFGGANKFNNEVSNSSIIGTFTKNKATYSGGANYFDNQVSDSILTGTFSNHAVGYSGGANYFKQVSNSNISGTYYNNSAKSGGANYFNQMVSVSNITGAYNYNNATEDGGANYFNREVSNSNISGTYNYNNANRTGGANYFGDAVTDVALTGNYINNTGEDVIHIRNSVSGNVIRDSIFINNAPILVESGNVSGINVWFGNNVTNYYVEPAAGNGIVLSNWLFLNATADSNPVSLAYATNIVFNLFSYGGENVSAYDNSRLLPVNLTITSTLGSVDPEMANLDESIIYTPDSCGMGSVTATVENIFCTIELNISKSNPNLSIGSQEVTYGENIILAINYGVGATGMVNITLKGKNGNYTFTDMELSSVILLANQINADDYNVTVVYSGDGKFTNATATANLTVKKMGTKFTANAITATYNINKKLVITLKGTKGNALSGIRVTVNLNGVRTYTTNNNGQIKINVAKLIPKAYTAKITFAGNKNYKASSANVKVTVKKAKSTLVAKKKTFKKSQKIKKYTIKLKSGKTAIKKVQVALKIKGKIYKAKTNNNGKVTFKINKLTKKGTFKAIIKFKGNKYYKAVANKVKIKITNA